MASAFIVFVCVVVPPPFPPQGKIPRAPQEMADHFDSSSRKGCKLKAISAAAAAAATHRRAFIITVFHLKAIFKNLSSIIWDKLDGKIFSLFHQRRKLSQFAIGMSCEKTTTTTFLSSSLTNNTSRKLQTRECKGKKLGPPGNINPPQLQ